MRALSVQSYRQVIVQVNLCDVSEAMKEYASNGSMVKREIAILFNPFEWNKTQTSHTSIFAFVIEEIYRCTGKKGWKMKKFLGYVNMQKF